MPYPIVKRDLFKHYAFSKHPVLYSYYDLVPLLFTDQVDQDLEFLVILRESSFSWLPVLLVLLIKPFFLVHSIIRVKCHLCCQFACRVHHSPFLEFVHQCGIWLYHIVVCLQHVLWIMPTYWFISPFPKIERRLAMLNFLRTPHHKHIEIRIFMNSEIRIPPDLLVF